MRIENAITLTSNMMRNDNVILQTSNKMRKFMERSRENIQVNLAILAWEISTIECFTSVL